MQLSKPGSFRPRMPFHMVLLVTDACTARCQHCSSNSDRRGPDELDTQEALQLIDQFAAAGVLDLAISGGEPLLRKDVFQILARAKQRGMTVGIGSNGAKLTPRDAAVMANLGLNRFQVSLDGLPKAHDELRCWPGLFDRVLRTIGTADAAGLRVHVCCTINRLNADTLESFVEFLSTFPVRRLNFSRFVPTGRGCHGLDLCNDEWRQVILRCADLRTRFEGEIEIVSHLAQQILIDDQVLDMPGFVGCQAGRGQGCVTANGTVFPCVLLPIPIGNIREEPFARIWSQSPVIRALQDREGLGNACRDCHVRERCGGCRAVAYAKTGDFLATDPRCWIAGASNYQTA